MYEYNVCMTDDITFNLIDNRVYFSPFVDDPIQPVPSTHS